MIGYYAVFLCSLIMAAESVTNAANVTATATHEIGSASIAPPSATSDSHHGIAKILVFMSTCSKRLFSSRAAVCILLYPPASKCPVKQVVCEFAPHQPDESRKAFEFMDAEARNLDAEIPVYLP